MSVLKFFWTAIFCSLFIASCQKSTSDVSNSGPNILLILADDMGYGELGSYGQQKIKIASQDLKRIWKMKQEKLSPKYTTKLEDIIVVKV